MSTITPKLIRIDASALANATCFLRFYRHVVEGYRAPKKKLDMEFGSAYHIFREELALNNGDKDKAIAKAVIYFNNVIPHCVSPVSKDYLTAGYLVQLCEKYVQRHGLTDAARDFQYIRNEKGEPLVEQTFSIEFYADENIKVLLQGTIDEIGKFKNGGCIAFGDDKTTGSYTGEKYLSEHEMKNQLLTYAFALREYQSRCSEINPYKNIFAGRIHGFINGVFLKKNITDVEFVRSKLFFFDSDIIAEYHSWLTNEVCMKLSRAVARQRDFGNHGLSREGHFNNTCSGNYGECPYVGACRVGGESGERLVRQNFTTEEYKPLSFRKAKVEV